MFEDLINSLDIIAGLRALMVLGALGALGGLWAGLRLLGSSGKVRFFRMRRQQLVRGWRLIGLGVLMALLATSLWLVGEPAASAVFTLTATPSLTASPSPMPSPSEIQSPTSSPTITNTPSESETPPASPTAHVPLAVEAQFTGLVTPAPGSVFSPLIFAKGLNAAYQPLGEGTQFANPVGRLYALFSYDQMADGVQWTALWYFDDVLVHYETKPWDGGTGGLGYTDWNPEPEEWRPGIYHVQIFAGLELKVFGEFVVTGEPATRTATPTASHTPTQTLTPAPTRTPRPTDTRWPTETPTE